MRRGLLAVVLLGVFLLGSLRVGMAAQRRSSPPRPTAVLAPVFIECQDMMAAQTARQLAELAVQNLLGMDLIDPARADRAIRNEFDARRAPADLYPAVIGGHFPRSFLLGYPPYGFPAPGQMVASQAALFWPYSGFSPSRTGHLVWLGERLGADYAIGVEHRIRPRVTRHLFGQRLNGRDQIWVTIVEIRPSPRVSFIYWPMNEKDEFGVVAGEASQQQTIGTGVTVLGALMASGVVGRGRTTRTLGWLGMLAPQAMGAKGSETQVQIDATVLATGDVFTRAAPYVR